MATLTPKDTPAQKGVQYLHCAAPTFDGGNLVPMADSWSEKEGAELERSKDNEGDVDNIGTSGHHLVASGDFKVKAGASIPHKGDEITDDASPARTWVVTGDVEATGFSAGGKPMMVKLELEYHPKVAGGVGE